MFTRNDYKEYLEEVTLAERAMIYQVEDIIASIDDTVLKAELDRIAEDEVRHYAQLMKFSELILLKNEQQKRAFVREHALGKAKLRSASTGREFNGYCVNISLGGACIEFIGEMPPQGHYSMQIDFYNNSSRSIQGSGDIKWSKQINSGLSLAGISSRVGVQFRT